MMGQVWFTRWLHQPLWLRGFSLAAGIGLLALAFWSFGLHPLRMEAEALASQYQQQERRYQASLRTLLGQPSLQRMEADITRLQQLLMSGERESLSLPVLVASGAGELELWQPAGQGGELTMKLRWQGVQAVLQYLSTLQHAATLSYFNLRVEQEQLHFRLVLGGDHVT